MINPLVAIFGGYQNHKSDPEPGHQIMWQGYECLSIASLVYQVVEDNIVSPELVQW